VLGLLLHILVGYVDRPMGIQIIAYSATLAVTLTASRWVTGRRNGRAFQRP